MTAKRRGVIFDVDGTLCDVTSIRHLVLVTHPDFPGYRNFDHFHRAAVWCPPVPEVIEAARAAHEAGDAVLLVTARRERFRPHTEGWMEMHGVEYEELHMRGNDDGREDSLVKRDILEDLRKRYEIVGAWDDNPSVVALWESEGIPVTVVPGWLT